jgi:hypothetical protein|tara:strand:+ start:1052 stop:1474 length:423 start_codon:yes stop_codon:yes gene_type:complete
MFDKKDALKKSLENNLPVETKHAEVDKELVSKKDINDDYTFSRDTYKDLISTGMGSLDALAEIARESEHPRAFEVLSKSIKDIGDVTDKLMALQKNKQDLVGKKEEAGKVTNNNMFIGSTTDLQRMLLNNNEKVIDADKE